ncbi:LysR family transcriptional regulator [Amycolatopsis sp. PS_44_ISF1]|uniref:LysR family transcriptional regulator n=1 Tax=Amycolatopsis sp. PS_44_ISF1 TaxID=2974917 RepID=UPI0028DFB0CB|nr:LysR family transcriptional regulator [Amycolatopsis sp. PS_44_ISF1]MDT8910697.1 LysR family transcriptional regulator [Amycolatopsis sp. PS_44_ISF1]
MDLRELRYFVTVVDERHFGRAAARLHMTQPPLSRAIKRLETELGHVLLDRSPGGVTLTAAGSSLYEEARALLARADQVRTRVASAAGAATITIGTLAEGTGEAGRSGPRLAEAYRARHPGLAVRIREADLTDPTAGLRTGQVDVALTRAPFDQTGIVTHVLRTDPVGVVLRADDPLADRESLHPDDLADRPWFRLPEGTDPIWRAYWRGPGANPEGPVVRTAHECLQAVLWNGSVGVAPLSHALPQGLVAVALPDMPPSPLVVAWCGTDPGPLIRSFAEVAASVYGAGRSLRSASGVRSASVG